MATRGLLGVNGRIRVGIIGLGRRGRSLMTELLGHSSTLCDVTALCDLWSEARATAHSIAGYRTARAPKLVRNSEEMYDAKLVDAVIIATPDFSHATLSLEAVRAGLDVYVEPPLAHLIDEAQAVRDACRQTGRIVQVGASASDCLSERSDHHGEHDDRCEGPTSLEFTWRGYDPRGWRRKALIARLRPRDTDWRRYQLNRPLRPFDPRAYLESRLFWPYSSGLPDAWLSRVLARTARMTGELYPSSCCASGAISCWYDGRSNADTLTAQFEYPSGLWVRCEANPIGPARCDVVVQPLGRAILAGAGAMERRSCLTDWLHRVQTRRHAGAVVEAGYAQAVGVAMAVAALHSGRQVRFDPTLDRLV